MLHGWAMIAVALGYIGLLFVIASFGDRRTERHRGSGLLIYPLSLAIYCTSWTFFGSVGLASRSGLDFFTIYLGPILVIGFCSPLIVRMARLAKAQNITSIADFIAARYGKGQAVATIVALIVTVGSIPYIALQLKAVSASLAAIMVHPNAQPDVAAAMMPPGDLALFVALLMATFAILFGTRHINATEHHNGLMLAIATESIVKLLAFLTVGVFVTFSLFDGPIDLFTKALDSPVIAATLMHRPAFDSLLVMTMLSIFAIILLPRQFHVAVVENNSEAEIKRAAWLFPLYLVLINIFVVPIAVAGLLTFSPGEVDSDMFVVALPLAAGSQIITIIAFIGGLSAATAMVIVESVALSIMVSNDIVIPWVLHRSQDILTRSEDTGRVLLRIRRAAIFAIMILAYLYYRLTGDAQLSAIGLLSFAAVSQLAPAFFGGLFWRRGTGRGAIAGMTVGLVAWAYTLLLPSLSETGLVSAHFLNDGPFGWAWLRPQSLFGIDLPTLVHGVLWSLSLNTLAFIAFSLRGKPAAIERVQASIFANVFVPNEFAPLRPAFRRWRSSVTVAELTATVARYLGEERAHLAFADFAAARRITLDPKLEADFHLVRHAEYLLASAIGAASSRLVLALLLRKRNLSSKAALKLLDEANAAIHHNREILQTALEHVRQGIAVFDPELQLVCWNQQFGEILDLPPDYMRIGVRLATIVGFVADQDRGRSGTIEDAVLERMARYLTAGEPFLERFADRGLVIEVRANRMPDDGIVTTFTDMTPSVRAAEELGRSNETLELRVRERTEELMRLNEELAGAKKQADEANVSKTRFLAAASHDILQPLNAARLYVTSLIERMSDGDNARLAGNIDASLESVEEILGALLDISRLDTGTMRPDISYFYLDELQAQLEVEFAPLAKQKGIELVIVPSRTAVRCDRRLLRRLLHNLVSNAIKYTPSGRVLVGCRRRGTHMRFDVYDTGIGIPADMREHIFKEFRRLDSGARMARGVGLGLSIVERIARVLHIDVRVRSEPGRGSHFSVAIPKAAAAAVVPRRTRPNRPDPQWLAGTRVLCIDNEPTILDGMEAMLTGWGCTVVKATNLPAALETVVPGKSTPDTIIIDYHLDDGSGIEAAAALAKRIGHEVPCILITADRSPLVRSEARAAGIEMLRKPVKPAALRALLAQYHRRRMAAAE
jgi:Na+/proline symporter/signal transduction histidine kinase/ActR/RegA family two-component response regulator